MGEWWGEGNGLGRRLFWHSRRNTLCLSGNVSLPSKTTTYYTQPRYMFRPIDFFFVFLALQPTVFVFSQPGSGFLDHTQRRATVGRTPLDEWSIRRTDLYLTTHNTHNRQTSMPPRGIRTHNLSRRAAADLRLRPRGYWDRRPVDHIQVQMYVPENGRIDRNVQRCWIQ